jgi:hypothetical protein
MFSKKEEVLQNSARAGYKLNRYFHLILLRLPRNYLLVKKAGKFPVWRKEDSSSHLHLTGIDILIYSDKDAHLY